MLTEKDFHLFLFDLAAYNHRCDEAYDYLVNGRLPPNRDAMVAWQNRLVLKERELSDAGFDTKLPVAAARWTPRQQKAARLRRPL
jgi:hypothetical protein